MHILVVTLDYKLTFEIYLLDAVPKGAKRLGLCAEQQSYLIVIVCS